MTDTIGIETTGGAVLLAALDERAGILRFLDEDDRIVRAYALDTFATVTTGLVLDENAAIIIDAATVADLKEWAQI